MKKITKALDDRKRMLHLEGNVNANTHEVFTLVKDLFWQLLDCEEHEVEFHSSANFITAQIYGTTIGLHYRPGAAFYREETFINTSLLSNKDFRELVLSDETNNYFTGQILLYTKREGTPFEIVSRLFVNKHKQIYFRKQIGWQSLCVIKQDERETLYSLLEECIESAIVEVDHTWDTNIQSIKDLNGCLLNNSHDFWW